MQDKNFFLRTKLLPPRAVSELLDRPRLTKKLEAIVADDLWPLPTYQEMLFIK